MLACFVVAVAAFCYTWIHQFNATHCRLLIDRLKLEMVYACIWSAITRSQFNPQPSSNTQSLSLDGWPRTAVIRRYVQQRTHAVVSILWHCSFKNTFASGTNEVHTIVSLYRVFYCCPSDSSVPLRLDRVKERPATADLDVIHCQSGVFTTLA